MNSKTELMQLATSKFTFISFPVTEERTRSIAPAIGLKESISFIHSYGRMLTG